MIVASLASPLNLSVATKVYKPNILSDFITNTFKICSFGGGGWICCIETPLFENKTFLF